MNALMKSNIEWEDNAAVCVVMASGGYPVKAIKGYEISGLDNVGDLTVFHAGTAVRTVKSLLTEDVFLVLRLSAKTLTRLLRMLMQVLQKISWTDEFHRSDIGIKKY